MKQIVGFIDRVNAFVGRGVSWLSLLLVLVIVLDVFLRYVFNWSSPASFELEWHLFALIFLLSAGWTLQQDSHVRVDVFYNRFSKKQKAWVNLIGSVFLLLPMSITIMAESIPFVVNSFAVQETSGDPGGLPARYVIKAAIPAGFFFLALQAISASLTSILQITGNTDD